MLGNRRPISSTGKARHAASRARGFGPALCSNPTGFSREIVAICAAGLGIFVIAGALNALVERCGLFRTPLATACRRAAGLPRSAWGTTFAHAGLGLTLLGIVGETSWGTKRIASLKLKDSIEISGYTISLANVAVREGPNYREQIATFNVQKSGVPIGTMQPSKRAFTTRGTT